jgi:hypothetical protein
MSSSTKKKPKSYDDVNGNLVSFGDKVVMMTTFGLQVGYYRSQTATGRPRVHWLDDDKQERKQCVAGTDSWKHRINTLRLPDDTDIEKLW